MHNRLEIRRATVAPTTLKKSLCHRTSGTGWGDLQYHQDKRHKNWSSGKMWQWENAHSNLQGADYTISRQPHFLGWECLLCKCEEVCCGARSNGHYFLFLHSNLKGTRWNESHNENNQPNGKHNNFCFCWVALPHTRGHIVMVEFHKETVYLYQSNKFGGYYTQFPTPFSSVCDRIVSF